MRIAFLFSLLVSSTLTLALTLAAGAANAALGTDANSALSFFRNKNSSFASGQASRDVLQGSLLRSENEVFYRAVWDRKEYALEASQLLRDIQVARFVENKESVMIYSEPRTDAPNAKKVAAHAQLEVLEVQDFWARVQNRQGKNQGWVPLYQLTTRHDDLGVFTNIIATAVRASPSASALALTTLPRLQRIIPLEISKSFLKIQYEGKIGYADITHFASRADFATLAYHPKKNWITVVYRNNDTVITKAGEAVPLKELLGFVTSTQRGIVVKPDSAKGPPLRARVDIIKPEAFVWGVSHIKGHGEVWWKQKDLLKTEKPQVKVLEKTLTTDELMKREIYSIAFEAKNSLKGLVSSEGIYRTEDGQTWTLIPQFGKQNTPVSIHPNGTWFVGSYKSSNKGRSFDPFIRWDKLAQAIEAAHKTHPKILRLTQIEALPNSQVLISVDTGVRKVKLRSFIGDTSWKVVYN